MSPGDDPHLLLGRIRFLNRCIECFRRTEPVPESLCFVPKEVCYKICRDSSSGSASSSSSASASAAATGGIVFIPAWESPHQAPNKKSCKFTIEPKKGSCIRTSGEEYYNSHGLWVKITKEQMEQYRNAVDLDEGWILACKHSEGGTRLVPVEHPDSISRQQQLFGIDHKPCNRWEDVVDAENCFHLGARPKIAERDEAAVQKLRYIPPTWTFQCDEDLVHYFYDHVGKEDENLGSVKQCVNNIDVSSCSKDPSGGAACLTDGDTETYWESDGMQGQHWIRLHMKRGTVVRWPARHDQWWECKFIAEGIIDQGGGFRDSLADMSEELCPSSADCLIPLPFFTRTSNQGAGEARDFYVPNPSCRDLQKFEWIGQLMGAALRGKDFLVLALPGLVWKQLIGETISWSEDFPAVDSVLVKLLDAMEHMDKATFEFKFGQELVYSTPLSDGRLVELIPGGSLVVVHYEERMEFIRLVQKARLEESREQIAAMQAGLMKVVPQAVLDLLTWQEVEKKVCGDPEITVEALKRLTRYEDLEQNDVRVQHLWEALTNFTNEDRSRFLRFVTGRSRLPAPIYIFPDKQGSETTDALPQSSTCSSTLYLPKYPSAKVCEEKLRYAAYNCVAIDTDMSPWEE
ncbi:E3 ubiquitin-protein ligase HECTD3 isoform X1 [Silurus meridionalis]|nr:E3 ubiquitin-protein ligase HECTD3 isoform X1 [Silurus meridionalis]